MSGLERASGALLLSLEKFRVVDETIVVEVVVLQDAVDHLLDLRFGDLRRLLVAGVGVAIVLCECVCVK